MGNVNITLPCTKHVSIKIPGLEGFGTGWIILFWGVEEVFLFGGQHPITCHSEHYS